MSTDSVPSSPIRVVLLHKRGAADDEKFAHVLEKELIQAGCTVFIDRQTQLDLDWARAIGEQLNTLGQLHYLWPTPDGYPDNRDYWTTTSALLERFNIGFALAENTFNAGVRVDVAALAGDATTPEQLVDRLAARLLRRPLARADRSRLVGLASGPRGLGTRPIADGERLARTRDLVGVMLASPYFQYR